VLYDLGVVSTKEPFGRLVSQGMILGEVEYSYAVGPDGSPCEDAAAHDATSVRVRQTCWQAGSPPPERQHDAVRPCRNPETPLSLIKPSTLHP
jgi:leucyl-tRNA synthetase